MNYKLYVDLDGVLADFDKKVKSLGFTESQVSTPIFWEFLKENTSQGMQFWSVLDPMPDVQSLWNYIKEYNPTILTSVGGLEIAKPQKTMWVNKHFPGTPIIFTNNSEEKAKYANPTSILVDDRVKSIEPWEKAGGIGILHTSAFDTVAQLTELFNQ